MSDWALQLQIIGLTVGILRGAIVIYDRFRASQERVRAEQQRMKRRIRDLELRAAYLEDYLAGKADGFIPLRDASPCQD